MLTETASTNSTIDNADSLHVDRLPQFEPPAAEAEKKPKLSPAERSRQNGRKSKGPRTEAGKERVRFNALTHGITAKSPLLPGEDRSEFENRRAALHSQMRPRNELESELIDRLAQSFWVSRRSQRALVAQLTYRLRHEPLAAARAEQEQAAKLGQYLLKDVFRPVGILPCEQAGGARHPANVVFKLEATLAGCDWLLARFDRLKEHALIPGNWLENDGLELVRLLGKYRGELISDDLVAMVLLASECLAEESIFRAKAYCGARDRTLEAAEANAQAEAGAARPRAQAPAQPKPQVIGYYADGTPALAPSDSLDELDEDDEPTIEEEVQFFSGPACEEYRRLARDFGRVKYVLDETFRLVANQPSLAPCVLRLEKLNPKNVEQARERLTLMIDEHARRLREIRAVYAEIRAADAASAAERIAFGGGPEAERERKYVQAHDRQVNQSIGTYLKVRKAGNDGTIDEIEIASELARDFDSDGRGDLAATSPSAALRPTPSAVEGAVPSTVEGADMEPPLPDTSPKRQRGICEEDALPSGEIGLQCDVSEPSLALRAGMEPPAPAEEEPKDTSPKRQRGVCEKPKTLTQVVSQILCEEITCAEPSKISNKPRSEPTAPLSEPPLAHVVTGTVPSAELIAGPVSSSIPAHVVAGTVPSAELIAGPVSSSTPTPAAPPRTKDQRPMTKEEMQQKRFDALPRRIRQEIEEIRTKLWHHNGHPHLRKEQVNEFLAFIDKHLGADSMGPESSLRPRRQNP